MSRRADRHVLEAAIGAIVWNASNHPNPTAVLGRDIGPLRAKLVEAVMSAGFTRDPRPSEILLEAATVAETMGKEFSQTDQNDIYGPGDRTRSAQSIAARLRQLSGQRSVEEAS